MKYISALVLAIITFFQSLFGIKPPAPAPVVKPPQVALSPIKVSLVPAASNLEVHLLGSGQALSAISLRLVYHYVTAPNGVKITPNVLLTQNSWVFPVRKVTIDSAQKTLTMDMAAAVVSPTGYRLGSDLFLARINLAVLDQSVLRQFSFDPKLSQAFAKDVREIPLIY